MLLNKPGQTYEHDGTPFEVGCGIYAVKSDYRGLYGTIAEIRNGKDKDTRNRGVDVYCRFFPPINKEVAKKIEKRMSAYYGDPMRFDDIAIDLVIMAPDMLRPAKKCRVYQLTDKGCQFWFRPYELVQALGLTAPQGDLYHVVYDGDLHTDELEEIFYILNCRHPEGYKGWSLSMSDIVELYDEKQSAYYYCDTFGFQEVPFVPAEKDIRHV